MFETLRAFKMFAESYLASFMPGKEYSIFLGQKPAVNRQENLMTRHFPCCFENAVAYFKCSGIAVKEFFQAQTKT